MRNLVEHPLTADEASRCVSQTLEREVGLRKEEIGGIHCYALSMVEAFIKANPEQFNQFARDNWSLQ